MLSHLAWLIFLTLVVAAAPAVGLLVGLGCSAVFVSVSDRLALPWRDGGRSPRSGFELAFPDATEVDPRPAPAVEWKLPASHGNLPGRLLRERQHLFRVDCVDDSTGLPRTYSVAAKHAGAAEMKAHLWGERTRGIRPL